MDEPQFPYPPRFWWAKRIAVLIVLTIGAFFLTMYEWAATAQRRTDAMIAHLHSIGELATVADFQLPDIPDSENAAITLRTGYRLLQQLSKDQQSFLENNHFVSNPDAETLKLLGQAYHVASGARQSVRDTRFQSKVDWKVAMRSPVIQVLMPYLSEMRDVVNDTSAFVMYEHAVHHDAAAIESVRDMLATSDAADAPPAFIVTHLVALGMDNVATTALRQITPALEIAPADNATTQPAGPCSREQVRALIAQLLDERRVAAGYSQTIQAERLMQLDSASYASGATGMAIPKPIAQLDALRVAEYLSGAEIATRAPDLQTARQASPKPLKGPHRPAASAVTTVSQLYSMLMLPSLDRFTEVHYEALARRRAAALRLAIRLYQVDHHSEYPATLDELVPTYLQALPADPMRSDGKTFGYLLKHPRASAPVLYSVGTDGVDNGGDTNFHSGVKRPVDRAPGEAGDLYERERLDLIFPLGKPPPPSTQPSDAN